MYTLEGFTEGRLVVSEKNLHTTDFAKREVGRSIRYRYLDTSFRVSDANSVV